MNGRKPFRAFGMPGTHLVRVAGAVREEPCVKHVSFQPDFEVRTARPERLTQC
jgi:hypothetical protein